MKTTHWILAVLVAGSVAVGGCGKPKPPPTEIGGVPVIQLSKLRDAFPTPTAAQQAGFDKMAMSLRMGDFMGTLVQLDKLAHDPSLTEPQKKLVAEVIEQVKKTIEHRNAAASAPPGTPPAQGK